MDLNGINPEDIRKAQVIGSPCEIVMNDLMAVLAKHKIPIFVVGFITPSGKGQTRWGGDAGMANLFVDSLKSDILKKTGMVR